MTGLRAMLGLLVTAAVLLWSVEGACAGDTSGAPLRIGYDYYGEGSIDVPGEVDVYAFTGSVGDVVIIQMHKTSGDLYPSLELYDPDFQRVAQVSGSPQATIFDKVLTKPGTYTIYANDSGGDGTGDYWLSLQCRQHAHAQGDTIPYDSYLPSEPVPEPGDLIAHAFEGTIGEKVIIQMRNTSGGLYPSLELYDPDFQRVEAVSGNPQATIFDEVLAKTGTYTLYGSDSGGDETGTCWISLQCRQHAHAHGIVATCGAAPYAGSVEPPGDLDAYVLLSCSAGNVLSATMVETAGTDFSPRLELFNGGFERLTSSSGSSQASITDYVLPSDGIYTVYAGESGGNSTGSYDLTIECNCVPATGVPAQEALVLQLHDPRPNPAADESDICFDLPVRSTSVRLSIYSVSGRLVRTLRNGPAEPGRHAAVWDGRNGQGARVASGTYFVRLEVDDWSDLRRVVVIR